MADDEVAAERLQAIRQRLKKRREPVTVTCGKCGHQQTIWPLHQAIPGVANSWNCETCGGQMVMTVRIGGSEPTPDDGLQDLLDQLTAQALSPEESELVKLYRENKCGDPACEGHRFSAAQSVLKGATTHREIADMVTKGMLAASEAGVGDERFYK